MTEKQKMIHAIQQAQRIIEEIGLIAIGLPWVCENKDQRVDKKRLHQKGQLIGERCMTASSQLRESLERVCKVFYDIEKRGE